MSKLFDVLKEIAKLHMNGDYMYIEDDDSTEEDKAIEHKLDQSLDEKE